jgi:hypothetical protein
MKGKGVWGLVLVLVLAAAPAGAIEHRLGIGAHLWRTADELWDHPMDGDDSDLAGLLSYQLVLLRPLKLQLDVEFFPNGFGHAGEEAWSPQGLIVVGDRWYAAVGAGWIFSQNIEGHISDVLYIARLGADFPVLPRLRLDLFFDQIAPDVSGLADADEDTVTFAAVLRVRL